MVHLGLSFIVSKAQPYGQLTSLFEVEDCILVS